MEVTNSPNTILQTGLQARYRINIADTLVRHVEKMAPNLKTVEEIIQVNPSSSRKSIIAKLIKIVK